MTSPGEWVEVAKVRSVQAPRRELRLDATAPYGWPDPAPGWALFKWGGSPPQRLKVVETLRDDNGGVVIVLPPGVPRETVAGLRGAAVVVKEEDAGAYRLEGWHAPGWLGFTVRATDGTILGVVREVWDAPANAAFTVESTNGDAWTLPAIEQVVTEVDEDSETLTITGLEPHGIRNED